MRASRFGVALKSACRSRVVGTVALAQYLLSPEPAPTGPDDPSLTSPAATTEDGS